MFVKNIAMSKQMTEVQSLEIIREMIDKAKAQVSDDSKHYLLWGWLVLISSLSHYILLKSSFSMPWLPWVILMPLGGVIAGIMGYRESKTKKVNGHFERIMSYVWGGFIVMMFILLANGPRISWEVSYSLLIAMYGLATFISGGILKFKPLVYGGIAAWIISIVSSFCSMEYILLFMALSMVTSYLIPGYMLKRFVHAS